MWSGKYRGKRQVGTKNNSNSKKKTKWIYDNDEFDHRYHVDNCDTVDDDDDYMSEDDEYGDEEYDVDDDPRYRNDNFDEEDTYADGTLDSYTYDSWTFDDTLDTRTLDSRMTKKGAKQDDSFDKGAMEDATEGAASKGTIEHGFEEEKKEEHTEEVIEAPFLSDVGVRCYRVLSLVTSSSLLDSKFNVMDHRFVSLVALVDWLSCSASTTKPCLNDV